MNGIKTNIKIPEGPIVRTSKTIAYILLSIYGLCLLIVMIAAFKEQPSESSIWFPLFKSGFLLLGGALTTVIGYYFGSRGVQEAEASANIALREAEKAKDELEKERKKAQELQEQLSPTYDELTLEEPTAGEEEIL